MITRIDSLALLSTPRAITFAPGLNVIAGPMTTGKTSLLRLCRVLLGSPIEDLTPEVRGNVPAISGSLTIGESQFSVVRELVSTETSKVEISGDGVALRLPALRRDATASTTYGRWLLNRLGLPEIEAPSAPTRPSQSSMTPVSINDYMQYCRLSQEEIDSSVFGHNNPFKDIKRKYVFQIIYGLYNAEIASLQDRLRMLEARRRTLEAGSTAFESFLEGTPWENRPELQRRLEAAEIALSQVRAAMQESAEILQRIPQAQELRTVLTELDADMGELRSQIDFERRSAMRLEELRSQLLTQSGRLTKSIVADSKLLDIDFVVCPRCGAGVTGERVQDDRCYVCLQEPAPAASRQDLIVEQDRLEAQITETGELIDSHLGRSGELERALRERNAGRAETSAALDRHQARFIADAADQIADRAGTEAALSTELERLRDYLDLFSKLDAARLDIARLNDEQESIEGELERLGATDPQVEERIRHLEARFAQYIEAFNTPRFSGEPRAALNRETYMPIVNGRSFGQLSSGGLRTLTNLAHALAHHRAAIDLGLPLPGILLIDAIQKNVGRDEYDARRVEAVFQTLIELHHEVGDQLQLIVAANDVPDVATEFIRLQLSETDRLVPLG